MGSDYETSSLYEAGKVICSIFSSRQILLIMSKKYVRRTECLCRTKESSMQSFMLLLLIIVIFVGAFGFMMYRREAEKRAKEKKRNQYHDRV